MAKDIEKLRAGMRSRWLPPGEVGFRELLATYKRCARLRKIPFVLADVCFRQLTLANCHYCGGPPSRTKRIRSKTASQANKEHSNYTYNGVDRLDSSLGYTHSNSVTCCATCNGMKSSLSYRDFLEQARKITEHCRGDGQ